MPTPNQWSLEDDRNSIARKYCAQSVGSAIICGILISKVHIREAWHSDIILKHQSDLQNLRVFIVG